MTRSIALVVLLLAGSAVAQPVQQPYATMKDRPIKALSEQQLGDLRDGRGMALALPAELNGYPGPMHTLEHADKLALSAEQRTRTQTLFDAMRAEAVPLGERLIREEAELDRLFATKSAQVASLEAATGAIGATQGRLRAAHLRYHVALMDVLTHEQVRRYAEVRGYSGSHARGQHGHDTHRP